MWKPRQGTICYRPSATVPSTFLGAPLVAAALAFAGAQASSLGAAGLYGQTARALPASKADANAKDNQGRTALMAAASNGDVGVVQALLAAGADPRAADAGGGMALTYAAAAGSADAIDALQKRGVTPKPQDLV